MAWRQQGTNPAKQARQNANQSAKNRAAGGVHVVLNVRGVAGGGGRRGAARSGRAARPGEMPSVVRSQGARQRSARNHEWLNRELQVGSAHAVFRGQAYGGQTSQQCSRYDASAQRQHKTQRQKCGVLFWFSGECAN